jgi:hypothetical protein
MAYRATQVIKAIQEANGILSGAARLLGCSRTTVHNHINKSPTVKAAYEEANETMIDFAEQQLFKNIKTGKEASIFFFLKCKAKHRGYVERQELTGADGGPMQHEVSDVRDSILRKLAGIAAAGAADAVSEQPDED